MQPLELNLASQPFRNNTLLWAGYALGVALAAAFSFWNVATYLEYRASLDELRGTLTTIDAQLGDLDRREREALAARRRAELDVDSLAVQAAKANEVIGWKAFSWTLLFNRLERVLPWNVYMSAVRPVFHERRGEEIDPDAARRAVRVVVEGYAQDLGALFEFERRLFADPQFDDPEPERHAPSDNGEIVFAMRFTYYPEVGEGPGAELAPEDDAALDDAAGEEAE